MKTRDLIRKMSRLGFPLLETEEDVEANSVLYEVLKSKEARLWEGFPVLLANAANGGKFDYKVIVNLCKNKREKDKLLDFIILSLAVYDYFHLKFWWTSKFHKEITGSDRKKINGYIECLKKNSDLKISDVFLSSSRVKNIFENYFREEGQGKAPVEAKREKLSLEYALSQIFSPRQKALFFKKLRAEKMTKTEREYFSRSVKKKIIALSNAELHKLARKILES